MQELNLRRRVADRILILPNWQRVCEETHYDLGSLRQTFRGHNNVRRLATILYQGLWLQRAVAEKLPLAQYLANELAAHAVLSSKNYEDARRERVGAAFLLWPFHSARYYGYLDATKDERLESRAALCSIQAILYNNVRTLLDGLRVWFDCYHDAELRAYVTKPRYTKPRKTDPVKTPRPNRDNWRPAKLTQNIPDLCAVDFLVEHLLEVMKARPLVRRAIEGIQSLSVGKALDDPSEKVLRAFKELRVAQMTVFYHPNPIDVKDVDQLPLYELVHQMADTDSLPEKLIPFGDNPQLAKNFRRLANTIYTADNVETFPHFLNHRSSTIDTIGDATNFISDGAISNYFLTTKPPVQLSSNGNKNSNGNSRLNSLWPVWYRKALHKIDLTADLPDWSNEFWWTNLSRDKLKQRLFPGPQTTGEDLHRNDHLSAYWDAVAHNGQFLDCVEIPEQHPTGNPSFNYLMELLLRREGKTRTSFFFALAQTYDSEKPRLCQFVGGTFLGLERPGIPFSPERFEALAARVRGLVMAVAHFSTTQALKRERLRRKEQRATFNNGVDTIIKLLKGVEGPFDRDGYLLFASPDSNVPGERDHDYNPRTGIGWSPSRQQLKSVFDASHLKELSANSPIPGGSCSDTWKALFYLGGTANTHNTLPGFLTNWPRYHAQAPSVRATDMADRAIICEDCFRAALKFLLSPEYYKQLAGKIEITRHAIRFPSRPGIRFLIALCRFILDVHSKASPENTHIERIHFTAHSVIIDFDKPKLLKEIAERRTLGTANLIHTTGIFLSLESCQILDPTEPSRDQWDDFLKSPEYARPLILRVENDWQQLIIE